MSKKPQSKRGGRRPGAGRPVMHPEGATEKHNVTAPGALWARLSMYCERRGMTRSAAVTEAIRRLLGKAKAGK